MNSIFMNANSNRLDYDFVRVAIVTSENGGLRE